MAEIKDRLQHAKDEVVEKVTQAADWVKEKTGMGAKEGSDAGVAGIKPHMSVVASCGKTIGKVDHLDGNSIKLTKDSTGDGMHHFLPTSMVDHVDSHVHLNKNSVEAMAGWTPAAGSCGSCG